MSFASPEQLRKVKDDFEARGESVAEWARGHCFSRHLVYAVLNGKCRAKRGQGHQIAVALGIKTGTAQTQTQSTKENSIDQIRT